MNVAIDIRCLMDPAFTGVGEYTFQLLDKLIPAAPQHTFYLFYNALHMPPHMADLWADLPNVKHCPYRVPNKLFNVACGLTGYPRLDMLAERSAGVKMDVFLSPNPYFSSYSPNVRLVQVVHDISPLLYPEFFTLKQRLSNRFIYKRVGGAMFGQASHVIAVSENTRQDVVAMCGVPYDRMTVVYPGLAERFKDDATREDCARVKKRHSLPEKYILFLGTVEPRKNISLLAEAFIQWQKNTGVGADVNELVVAGKQGWLEKDMPGKIHRLGYVAPEDRPAIYALAQLFVFPSFYEGFGFPVLEALSQGAPVITSAVSSLGEVFGDHALLIDPYRPAELAHAMGEYIIDNEKMHPRAERVAFARSFLWSHTAEKVLSVLEKTAAEKSGQN